jgi:4-diphosphocytidyl-2-C-methyl-D-erythritol kinase
MPQIELIAPAKINLHLEVLGRRRDGLHELLSLAVSTDLADRITIRTVPGSAFNLRVDPPSAVPAGEDNLVMRAARLMQKRFEVGAGLDMILIKKIPVAAGLGGGSADAAAALLALDRLWCLGLEEEELLAISAELGSDVPYCLVGGYAALTGRGEHVHPLPDLETLHLVLCLPPVAVPTEQVYERLDEQLISSAADDRVVDFVASATACAPQPPPWDTLKNDLEKVVIRWWPEVSEALTDLRSTACEYAAVTGSGGASFAVYEDAESASAAVASLARKWPVVQTVSRGRREARIQR